MQKTLGQRIRELRGHKDISLREFAKTLGVTAAHLSDIELGQRFPSEPLLAKLASELRVSIEDLQKYDNRVPLEDIKRLVQSDPAFGFALRTMIDKDVSAEDLRRISKDKPDRNKQ